MNIEKKEKLILLMKMIAEDIEKDAADFDGKPFTGKTMGEYMGNHGAAIAALANTLKEILNRL